MPNDHDVDAIRAALELFLNLEHALHSLGLDGGVYMERVETALTHVHAEGRASGLRKAAEIAERVRAQAQQDLLATSGGPTDELLGQVSAAITIRNSIRFAEHVAEGGTP